MFVFAVRKHFLKILNFIFVLNFFLMFSYRFDVLILKIIFNIFLNKNILKNNYSKHYQSFFYCDTRSYMGHVIYK